MSLQLSTRVNGAPFFEYGTGAIPAGATFVSGLAMDSRAGIYAANSGTVFASLGGLSFDSDGRLLVSSEAVARYVNGLPVDSSGFLCVGGTSAETWSNGLPMDGDGTIAAWSPAYLFADGAEDGYFYPIPTLGSAPNYTTAAGSTLVTAYGDPMGRMEDTSGNDVDATQSLAGSRPTAGGFPFGGSVRNELIGTETMSTQVVAVTAAERTLSFKGTGTVTLTGASTAGPLVGTGSDDVVSLTFTPSAGNLTLTVSGSVTEAQLELGGSRTAYQNRPFAYLVEQDGLSTVPAAYFDLTDDSVSLTLPAGTYTIVIPGNKGTWIGEGFVWAGGTFTIGPTTYTNGPDGLFSNVTGRWLMGGFAIDRALTTAEKAQVGRYYKARGNAGVWELSGELMLNPGGPFTTIDNWGGSPVLTSGELVYTYGGSQNTSQTGELSETVSAGDVLLFDYEANIPATEYISSSTITEWFQIGADSFYGIRVAPASPATSTRAGLKGFGSSMTVAKLSLKRLTLNETP